MENKYAATVEKLSKYKADLQYQIRLSKTNRQNLETYQQHIKNLDTGIYMLEHVRAYLKPIMNDITVYLGERKKQSVKSIQGAIRMATEIIPDAMPNVFLEIKGDEAWLSTTDGLMVKLSEGAGFKSILSAFLQAVTLGANPDHLQTIIFDERFAKVSVEHSTVLSTFLALMVQNMQIISIEQKPEVYMNVDHIEYRFEKQGDHSIVTREEHNNGENIQGFGTT